MSQQTTTPPAGDPPPASTPPAAPPAAGAAPPAQPAGDDPWAKLQGIVENTVKSIFAGHVADHHTAPDPKGSTPPPPTGGTTPPATPAGETPPQSTDDRGFLAKAFGL